MILSTFWSVLSMVIPSCCWEAISPIMSKISLQSTKRLQKRPQINQKVMRNPSVQPSSLQISVKTFFLPTLKKTILTNTAQIEVPSQTRSRRAANPSSYSCSFHFCKNRFPKNKHPKTKISTEKRIPGAKTRGKISFCCFVSWFCSSLFCRQSCGNPPDAAVASRPHSPRPKDCSGLGYPNTLKKTIVSPMFLRRFQK